MKTFAPTTSWDPRVHEYLTHAFGDGRLRQLSEALCRPSLRASLRINTLRTTSEEALRNARQLLPHHPCHLHSSVPAALVVEGRGPLQPDYEATGGKEVVVNRLAAEAVLKGADVFAPGLLAATPGICEGDLVAVSTALELPGRRWCGINRGMLLTPAASAALPDRTRLYIGAATATAGRPGLFRAPSGLALRMQHRVFDLPPCHGLLPGLLQLQALPCIAAAHALAPPPGARVLDLCAAPGGKATMLAQLMGGSGQVVALDRTRQKVQEVARMAAGLGLDNVVALLADSTQLYQRQPGQRLQQPRSRQQPPVPAAPVDGGGRGGSGASEAADACGSGAVAAEQQVLLPESFDAVLLDAPCSALGLRPRLLLDWTLPALTKLASYQRALLHSAVHMLRPGGSLVYCTCTINPGEDEANVRYALDTWPQLRLVEQPLQLAGPGLTTPPGGVRAGEAWLTAAEAVLVQRFTPGDGEQDTIGFFIAKFTKVASTVTGT